MEDRVDEKTTEEKDTFSFKEYDNLKELVIDHHHNSREYKLAKLEYDKKIHDKLLNTDWSMVNEKRKEEGLPKLGNQDMKEYYVESQLEDDKKSLLELELVSKFTYDLLRFALEYSVEAIK